MTIFQKKLLVHTSTLGFFIVVLFLLITTHTFAAVDYKPIVGLPGLENLDKTTSIATYINAVYLLIIGLGALLGVMRIAWAGVKYSLSDIVTNKESAKHDIQGVLLGLAILLIPFIVLNTINPDLVNLNVLKGAVPVKLEQGIRGSSETGFENTTIPGTTVKTCPVTNGDATACKETCKADGGSFTYTGTSAAICRITEK